MNGYCLNRPPRRVVSLVPSLTESLFDLGLGETLVGITDYCLYPARPLLGLPHVGGPKNPRAADIIALAPDLILANQEENAPGVVKFLQQAGLQVWISFPKSVRESLQVLYCLADIFRSQAAVLRVDTLDLAVKMLESSRADLPSRRYFCPIWQDRSQSGQRWWMTFNKETYSSDLLYWLGGENVFADRQKRNPLEADLGQASVDDKVEGDRRYPRLSLEEIRSANPELILLPDEPYKFNENHISEFCELFPEVEAVRKGKVILVDGSLITWYGTRLGKAISELQALFPSK